MELTKSELDECLRPGLSPTQSRGVKSLGLTATARKRLADVALPNAKIAENDLRKGESELAGLKRLLTALTEEN